MYYSIILLVLNITHEYIETIRLKKEKLFRYFYFKVWYLSQSENCHVYHHAHLHTLIVSSNCFQLISISLFFSDSLTARELKICGSIRSGGEVCCSADMELRLHARARDKHEKATKETLQRMHQVLSMRGTRFHSECIFCLFFFFFSLSLRTRQSDNWWYIFIVLLTITYRSGFFFFFIEKSLRKSLPSDRKQNSR